MKLFNQFFMRQKQPDWRTISEKQLSRYIDKMLKPSCIIYDHTWSSWGHAITSSTKVGEKMHIHRVTGINGSHGLIGGKRIKAGDFIKMEAEDGSHIFYFVLDIDWPGDPWDFFSAHVIGLAEMTVNEMRKLAGHDD